VPRGPRPPFPPRMNRHPPGAHELALRVLHHEGGCRGSGGSAAAAAVERAWGKLSRELEPLVGKGGADALITRAVHLARLEFPFLGPVRPTVSAPVDFAGMRESFASREDGEAEGAGAAVIEHLLGLLVGLLGEDLGLAPVRGLWPEAAPGASSPPSNER